MLYQSKNKYPVEEAVLHCAAVSGEWWKTRSLHQMVAEVRGWHMSGLYPWSDIGYHIVVHPHGHFMFGRPLDRVGAHVAGANSGKLGILLIETRKIDRIRQFSDYFTSEQRAAVLQIAKAFGLKRLRGHNDFTSKKLCPGFHVEKEFRL